MGASGTDARDPVRSIRPDRSADFSLPSGRDEEHAPSWVFGSNASPKGALP
jgi:hypothetical protein